MSMECLSESQIRKVLSKGLWTERRKNPIRKAKPSCEIFPSIVLLHCEKHWHLGEMCLVVRGRFNVRGKRWRA